MYLSLADMPFGIFVLDGWVVRQNLALYCAKDVMPAQFVERLVRNGAFPF